jgi:hypothetical protein
MYTFIEYLKLKYFFGKMPKVTEVRCLFDAPGVLQDNLFLSALMAKESDVQFEVLLQRIVFLQRLLRLKPWNKNLFDTYNGCVNYKLFEVRRPIRKVKKYSGYARNSSAVGSKRKTLTTKHDPETFEWDNFEEIDYYGFLTVGKFSGSALEIVFPEDGGNKPETVLTHLL